jgi:hypothetical protein
MPLSINIITNNFGRVVPEQQLHVVSIGFKVTDFVGNNPTFQKSLDNVNWFNFNGTNPLWNVDGFVSEYVLPPHKYNFYVRQVGHEGDVASILNYQVESDIISQGLHPLGNTPKILNNTLEAGSNRVVSIETTEPGQYVKIYGSVIEQGQEVFPFPYLPLAEGISNANKLFTANLNLRVNQKICAAAQNDYELESYSANTLTVGNTSIPLNNKKLDVLVAVKSLTAGGRLVSVSAVGGSGNYTVSKGIGFGYSYQVNEDFELPFGRNSIILKDNTTGAIFSRSVHILPAGQQVITDVNLRSNFSATVNPNGQWVYGSIQNNNFTNFNSFGIRAAGKEGWGINNAQLPMLGYGENLLPLASNALVFSPNHDSNNAANNYQTAAQYTFLNAGIFNSSNITFKKPTFGTILLIKHISKYTVKHNNTILFEGFLEDKDQIRSHSINNLAVQSGDTLTIIIDSANSEDGTSPVNDDVHVSFIGQLVSNSYTAPTAPNAPTLVQGTGGSISEIVQGTNIIIRTTPGSNWIVVKKNNIPFTVVKSVLSAPNYDYSFIGGISGNMSIKTVSQGVYNSEEPLSFAVKNSGAVQPPAPTVSTTTGTAGSSNTITSTVTGTLQVFIGANLVTSLNIIANQPITYTYNQTGTYSFKLLKDGIVSNASSNVVISAGSSDCSQFINAFSLGTFTDNNLALSVFVHNNIPLIKQVFDISGAMIIRNGNFLNFNLVTSAYKGVNCFGHPKSDVTAALGSGDIGNIPGYEWKITNDGRNVPYLSPTNTTNKSYRVAASTPCEGETIKFAISSTTSNPVDIPDSAYLNADGTIRVNLDNIEDPNATPKFYKIFTVPSGVYNVFYKVANSPTTPVTVVSHNFN